VRKGAIGRRCPSPSTKTPKGKVFATVSNNVILERLMEMVSEPGLPANGLQVYRFRRRVAPLFTREAAAAILEAAKEGVPSLVVSLDLWRGRERVEIRGGSAVIRGIEVSLELLGGILDDDRSVYMFESGELRKVEVRTTHFYKLVKTAPGHAPTLEIDGIHMHRVSGVYPEEDAYLKVRGASRVLRGGVVLDTCTGLGYTAIWAAYLGASRVITVEKNWEVLRIAEANPWSWALESPRITTVNDDSSRLINSLPDMAFSAVIHDPPRISLAGELYSEDFYRELYRVMRVGGVLIHYVGRPGERWRGLKLRRGVMERLRRVGFTARWNSECEAVEAVKPLRRGWQAS